jgi:Txe/YoeB family toxin of Txe-Axe toxin-antitoxin module
MPRLEPGARFTKAYRKIAERDETLFRQIKKALKLFEYDIHHPGLNFEKIKGADYCSIRANQGDRIILRATSQDTFEIVDVGDHDTMYRRHS